jgi:hypothetical protein
MDCSGSFINSLLPIVGTQMNHHPVCPPQEVTTYVERQIDFGMKEYCPARQD